MGDGTEELVRSDILNQEGTGVIENKAKLRIAIQGDQSVTNMALVGTGEDLEFGISHRYEERDTVSRNECLERCQGMSEGFWRYAG